MNEQTQNENKNKTNLTESRQPKPKQTYQNKTKEKKVYQEKYQTWSLQVNRKSIPIEFIRMNMNKNLYTLIMIQIDELKWLYWN